MKTAAKKTSQVDRKERNTEFSYLAPHAQNVFLAEVLTNGIRARIH